MIFAASIPHSHYWAAREVFSLEYPEYAWGLSETVQGDAYYIPKHDAYCVIQRLGYKRCRVLGAFKFEQMHPQEPTAVAVVDLCRSLGYSDIRLDCYAPVRKAWLAAGFKITCVELWNQAMAPKAWTPARGQPTVNHMRRKGK